MRSEGAPRAVVDTNVWVAGLINPRSPPGAVLKALRDGELQAVATVTLVQEILEVLRRPALRERYSLGDDDVREATALVEALPDEDADTASLRDPDDRPVLQSARSGDVDMVITGDGGPARQLGGPRLAHRQGGGATHSSRVAR